MAERRSCVCGKEYWWPAARWQHEQCAINNVSAINADAINEFGRLSVQDRPSFDVAQNSGYPSRVGDVDGAPSKSSVESARSIQRTANRRSREDYNAYMKAYMRKRRGS
jgi:hypothetical protein